MSTQTADATQTLDPNAGTGQTISLSLSTLLWQDEIYEADPTGGNPSNY